MLFVRALYGCEDVFDRWRIPEYAKPVVGGALMGLLGVGFPQVFGTGYGPQPLGGPGPVDLALLGRIGLGFTAALWLLKILATSLTIGSGGSGGVFAPSLFIGAMLGGAFGHVVHTAWPGVTANPGAYALVGMGAVFAGAARAPITSVLILFEMTGDYRIILPLMVAVVTSTLLVHRFTRDTIYSLKIRRRGIELPERIVSDLLDTVTVGEVMTTGFQTVPEEMSVRAVTQLFLESGHHGFPVVDRQGHLAGVVTLRRQRAAEHGDDEQRTVADIATLPHHLLPRPDGPRGPPADRRPRPGPSPRGGPHGPHPLGRHAAQAGRGRRLRPSAAGSGVGARRLAAPSRGPSPPWLRSRSRFPPAPR